MTKIGDIAVEEVDGELLVFVDAARLADVQAVTHYRVVGTKAGTSRAAIVRDERCLKRGLNMLRAHPMEVNPLKALEKLPVDTPIRRLKPYLESVLRHRSSQHRDNQVVKQLLKKEHLNVMQSLAKLHQVSTVIDRHMQCSNPTCQRRFQGDGALVRFPGGEVVHYACWKSMQNNSNIGSL